MSSPPPPPAVERSGPPAERALADAAGVLSGSSHEDAIGGPVAFVGDVDADGRQDVAIGAGSAIFVVSGSAFTGLGDEAADVARATLTDSGGGLPSVVLATGDGDLWVGPPYRRISGAATGAVDLAAATVVVDVGRKRGSDAVAADLDGDGLADLAAIDDDALLVFHGPFIEGVTGPDAAALRLEPTGSAVAAIGADHGDLDGDGDTEVVVGTTCGENGSSDVDVGGLDGRSEGTVRLGDRVFFLWWVECPAEGRAYAASVLGDVDGDGHADLGFANAEAGYVVHGPLSGQVDPAQAALTVRAQRASPTGSEFLHGPPVSPGDTDGDGYAEIAFGARLRSVPRVAVLAGTRSGVVDEQGWDEVFAATPLEAPRILVRGGGDLTGDGVGDLLVGAPPTPDPGALGHVWLLSGADLLD